MIGVGHESQGFYYLTKPSSPVDCISTESPSIFHNRLGHSSLSKLQKIVLRVFTISTLNCESCQLEKMSRTSFSKRVNNRTTSPFELVHNDVWGPCHVPSVFGFRYFVTFIDDYSRCTWVFLLKNRLELFPIFKDFYAEIHSQFNVSIRAFRSDNDREYFSALFFHGF